MTSENVGDNITYELIRLLNTQYVTPIDREDIYSLATAIDNVVDYLDDASELIDLYHIEHPMEQAIEQCADPRRADRAAGERSRDLRGMRGGSRHLVALKKLEDEGDRSSAMRSHRCSATSVSTG